MGSGRGAEVRPGRGEEQMPGPVVHRTDTLMGRLLLTREQVASVLGVPNPTVEYHHRVRQLRVVRVGKYNMWKPEVVRQYAVHERGQPVQDDCRGG